MTGDVSVNSMEALMGLFAMDCRKATVDSLLVGNDTQCFTIRQYTEAYIRDVNGGHPCLMDDELSEFHLVTLRSYGVRQVRSGVWTKDTK